MVPSPLAEYDTDLDYVLRRVTDRTKAVMLGSPHNPATTTIPREPLLAFLDVLGPDSPLVILDQAYMDFCDDADHVDGIRLLERYPRLVVLRTFSKIAGLAGLRVGYAVASVETIDRFNRVRAPYNVNRLGQVAALAALEDDAHAEKTRRLVLEERAYLSAELTKRGYALPPSHANFLLVAVADAAGLRTRLLRAGRLAGAAGFHLPPLRSPRGPPLVLGAPQARGQRRHALVERAIPIAHREVRCEPFHGEIVGDGALVAVHAGRLGMRLQVAEALVAVGI